MPAGHSWCAVGVGLGEVGAGGNAPDMGGEGLDRLLNQLLGLVEVHRVDSGQAPNPIHHEVLGGEPVLPALIEGQPLQVALYALLELVQQGLVSNVCDRK